jgi:hypothetical protein
MSTRKFGLPDFVWLGIQVGEWPIQCFPSESMARSWAAEHPDAIGANRARRIWRVDIPADVEVYRVAPVPATTQMEAAR